MSAELTEAVWALLDEALYLYQDSGRAVNWLHHQRRRLDEPLRIAVAGPPGSGKTTLVDALRSTRPLRHAEFVDAPPDVAAEQVLQESDAVLYLTRHVRPDDLRFLDHNQRTGMAPVNVILVLSRADEVNGGRVDALVEAKRISRRYRQDIRLRSRCQGTVAVAGLLAHAARSLSEPEFAALAALAAFPRPSLSQCLLSTDRFTGAAADLPVGRQARQGLVDRLGLSGVRLATTLIRTGCDTRSRLEAQLARRSGLTELRDMLVHCFVDRRAVLKARSALLALEFILQMERRPGTGRLHARLEHVLAATHDFRELRLEAALRGGAVRLPSDVDIQARRLIGADGASPAARLGADAGATVAELWELGADALASWQERAESPLLGPDQRLAAQIVVRSCEGILARLMQ